MGIALDETVQVEELDALFEAFAGKPAPFTARALAGDVPAEIAAAFARQSTFLTHEVFRRHRSEHDLLRYLHRLESKDLSLTTSMM